MAKRERTGNTKPRPIIIRRDDGDGKAHHGGAWKVAYADFVTAMMAFFLVMWLINATTEDQRKGLADYFSPTNLMSHNSSGTGKPFGGETAFSDGAMVSDKGAVEVTVGLHPVLDNPILQRHRPARQPPHGGHGPGHAATDTVAPSGDGPDRVSAGAVGRTGPTEPPPGMGPAPIVLPGGPPVARARPLPAAPAPADRAAAETRAFVAAGAAIRRLVRQDPRLAALAGQLTIDITPRGLRIQLLDARHQPMFRPGSAVPNPAARRLLRLIAPIVAQLAGPVRIAGFTDAAPYPGAAMTNWDLSAARANAARRLLTRAGLADARIQAVTGHGDHDLLLPQDPLAPANRRISILVRRGAAIPPPAPLMKERPMTPPGQPAVPHAGGTDTTGPVMDRPGQVRPGQVRPSQVRPGQVRP